MGKVKLTFLDGSVLAIGVANGLSLPEPKSDFCFVAGVDEGADANGFVLVVPEVFPKSDFYCVLVPVAENWLLLLPEFPVPNSDFYCVEGAAANGLVLVV